MRVLHVISDENVGGAGVLLCTLLKGLDRNRVESLVALPDQSLLSERIEGMGIEIRPLRFACDRPSFASIHELSRIIRAESIDLVHANAALCARIAGKRCGVRVVHTRHCCYPPSRLQRILGGWNRRLSDHVIATADAAAENLRDMGILPHRIQTILNGSEAVREVGSDELEAVRLRYSILPSDFTVGIVARLEPCKGHETFLRGAEILASKSPRYRFLIIGTGSQRMVLEEMAHTLGISDRVIFTGFVSDMAPIYRLLRVNVNCSGGTETSCLAISEGMSAGLPTLVSDYGGNRAMIEGSEAGIVYPVGDFVALASAIESIAEDPEVEMRMRRAARKRYLERYTAEQMTDQVMALYETLTQKSGSL